MAKVPYPVFVHSSPFCQSHWGQRKSSAVPWKNNTLIVKTEQEKTILKWKNFSIKKGETTHFIQPSEVSVTLNRVLGETLLKFWACSSQMVTST
ncbi:hypothetical protein [Candidatus Neptunichlamydia sp. REUL1]|uniref:hypothetical protein n=1 Tax=Candidatus Neptunichlamydia sp. REUL1 TaxID=3064277 RepID=UPI00292CC84A|nr:hypothetical protein [Candidatus Neptunochlamydia sp. REUL1]